MFGFIALSMFVMVMMGSISKSVAGAMLGESVVCLVTSYLMFQQGGWNILWGILALLMSVLCILIVGIISFPVSWTSHIGFDERGRRTETSRLVIGEGSKTETLRLPSPTYIIQMPNPANYQIERMPNDHYLQDGSNRIIGN